MSSGEGEDEAIQAADVGEAADEDTQDFIEALYTTQERELGQIDKALDAVETADSREVAVAALARATVGINALYSDTPPVAPLEYISPLASISSGVLISCLRASACIREQRKWNERGMNELKST